MINQPIQFILILFLLFAISRVYLRAKEGTLSLGEILFWGGLFSLATYGVIDSNFLSFIAKKVGIGRGADVAIYSSIILLFYLIFRTNVILEDLRHEITKLVRYIALNQSTPPTTPQTRSRKKPSQKSS